LVKAQFVAGRPDEAIAKLQAGRNCLVPDHFLRAANLKLGDQFSLVPPHSPTTHVEYTIVGAVSLPGWHWMSKVSGLRRREGRSAAMVFADFAVVRRDFELPEVNFFWLNVDQAGDAKPAAVAKIGEALQPIAERNMAAAQPFPAPGPGPFGASKVGQSVRISTPDEVGARLLARASGVIWASCYLALITLVVTSLGVINTVMASVRARRWEFGVLRSQGVTRSGLVRMVLAEGLLIGLITCLLSLAFGVFSAWCGTGISQSVSFFGGLAPPLVIPWPSLAFGFALTLALCLAAALGPAVATGRAEPLRLLQEGRAAL
jgi:putative ABC transport system permease protein